MTANESTVDVCVIGAGPVGATLACALATAGLSVAVIDRSPLPPMENPEFDGRAYAVAAGSRSFLETAGIWSALPQQPCPIHDIRVSDGRVGEHASTFFLHFDHCEAERGPFGWMVEARSLRVAVNAQMHRLPGLQVHAPATVSIERKPNGAIVRINDGSQIACRLVVGAEGRGSPLRVSEGIPVTQITYRQSGIVCAIAHQLPHNNGALEHFLPGGPFAQLPMSGIDGEPNISAIVWTERSDIAPRMMALDNAEFRREVSRRLGNYLGKIKLVGQRWLYPLGALHAQRYTGTRLALVGDAAHGIHPIAGQGLNLGFRDVIALSELLTSAVKNGDDPGCADLLSRYQARRRPDNLVMLTATHALDRLFSTDDRTLRIVRDVGIASVNRLPLLKRVFMRQAMGRMVVS